MFTIERTISLVSIIWVIIAFTIQIILARGSGRKDYSAKAGSPLKGIIYNLTWAMTPAHKESARLHIIEFIIGVLMHLGIFIAIVKSFIAVINPDSVPLYPIPFSTIFAISSICALYLFFRRASSIEKRALSIPDDYLSILITLGFLIVSLAHELSLLNTSILLIYTAILFFYMPFGKLKHAVFFFVVRIEFGARLGYRGTYPVRSDLKG